MLQVKQMIDAAKPAVDAASKTKVKELEKRVAYLEEPETEVSHKRSEHTLRQN